jgi:hypothetical protein
MNTTGLSRFWAALLMTAGLSNFAPLHGHASAPQRGVQDVTSSPAAAVPVGPYYALVIGNNDYKYLGQLKTAVNDASSMAQLLSSNYGFIIKSLYNATRLDILTVLNEYRRTLPRKSNLLIYYAGHGHHDRETGEAYWLPVDAQPDNNANWISAADITADIRAIQSLHVLIISDSCYSGVLNRDASAGINPRERSVYLAKMLGSPSRDLMASGGDEPVADGGAEGHSVFAATILESLSKEEDAAFSADDLFHGFIQQAVAGRSEQTPQYGPIRNSGHAYGDFVFFRTKNAWDDIFKLDSLNKALQRKRRSQSSDNLFGDVRPKGTVSELLKDVPADEFEAMLWRMARRGEILRRSRTMFVDTAALLFTSEVNVLPDTLKKALVANQAFMAFHIQIVDDRKNADVVLRVRLKNPHNLLDNSYPDHSLVFELLVAGQVLDGGSAAPAKNIFLDKTDNLAMEIVKVIQKVRAEPWPPQPWPVTNH